MAREVYRGDVSGGAWAFAAPYPTLMNGDCPPREAGNQRSASGI